MPQKTQLERIRTHLESGKKISPLFALNKFGCFRLGARIWDLKGEGMNIETEMYTDGKKTYARYSLIVEPAKKKK